MTVKVVSLIGSDIGVVTIGKEYTVLDVDVMRGGVFICNDDGEEWFMTSKQVEYVEE